MSYPTIKIYFLLVTCLFIPQLFFAQEDHQTEIQRPKIGLVLSGGGAKGIAHIGILKAMEKEGLRPDFITGTSMGSIIGGLYALGYSANQLDSIIRSVNWDLVLSNNIPLDNIAYEEKEYYNRYLFEFPFEEGKLKLPSGLIQGQVLSELLSRFTWPANKYETFDEFPIPFRCIATDVSTGKSIVFDEGSLAKAIRASMSIPTAFTAVDLDTTLAVDGGVVNNFPVDVVVNMGADIVIGVNVGDGMIPAKELDGMTDILFQVSMIPSLTKMEDQIKLCDIYIKPELKDYGTASFGNYQEILELGDMAGEEKRPEFRALAERIDMHIHQIEPLNIEKDVYYIEEIRIEGNQLVNKGLILSKLQIKEGDNVSPENIEDGTRTIFGTNNFAKVTYELDKKPDRDGYILTLKLLEKKPVVVKGSFHYDNTFSAGILLNFTFRNLLGKSSRAIAMGDISKNPKLRLDYLKYIGQNEKIALNLRYQYLNEQIPSYSNGDLQDIDISYENDFSAGFITTQSLRRSFYLGGVYQFMNQKTKFETYIPEGVKHGAINTIKAEAIYQANTLNDRNYPTSGRELAVLGQFYLSNRYKIIYEKGVDTVYFPFEINGITLTLPISENDFNELLINPLTPDIYGMVQMDYKQFINVAKNFQILPEISAGITLSAEDTTTLFFTYRIGGYQRIKYNDNPFYGLNFAEVDYENFLMGGLFFQNILFKNLYFKYGGNFLLPYKHIPLNNFDLFNSETLFKQNSLFGYGVKLTLKSILGPISAGLSRNTRDSYFRYYLAIGFSFNYTD